MKDELDGDVIVEFVVAGHMAMLSETERLSTRWDGLASTGKDSLNWITKSRKEMS